MKDSTRITTLWLKIMLLGSTLFLFCGVISAQTGDSIMYGDTVFLQDFGTCSATLCNNSIDQLGGLDTIGSTYQYQKSVGTILELVPVRYI
jgi:hypothetical protein